MSPSLPPPKSVVFGGCSGGLLRPAVCVGFLIAFFTGLGLVGGFVGFFGRLDWFQQAVLGREDHVVLVGGDLVIPALELGRELLRLVSGLFRGGMSRYGDEIAAAVLVPGDIALETVEGTEDRMRDLGARSGGTALVHIIERQRAERARDRIRGHRARQLPALGKVADREIGLLLLLA